jgi:hypothetical protein
MLSVQDKWSKSSRDRALSIDGYIMWFMAFSFEMWHNMSPGRAIRGKWRISDGKGHCCLVSCSKL